MAQTFHPRNRHQGHYDFQALKERSPKLKEFVALNRYGDESIDFTNPEAVKELNRALLQAYYGIQAWDIPKGFLCPPIPGRADYIHHLSDLIGPGEKRILDIGTGANLIYPLLGYYEYQWSFVGADVNPIALRNAEAIAGQNAEFSKHLELRLQSDTMHVFKNIIQSGERFSATLCNPPFHESKEDALASNQKKWKNLDKGKALGKFSAGKSERKLHEKQSVNFGGQAAELWCEGGERRFTQTLIQESALFRDQVEWFTTLVSREADLPWFVAHLKNEKVREYRILDMAQGQKKSRILAWRFE